jgi:beta-galactosidase
VTPPSLGYVTLPLKPTQGKVVCIQLTGDANSSDALELTEVTGKQNIDEGKPRSGRGALGIVEAELYGPAPSR